MEQRYSLVTLATRDLARSIGFFEGLGWVRSMRDASGVAFFQCGGVALALYPRDEFFRDIGIADDGSNVGGITLAYNARSKAEVDAVLEKVAAHGGEILKPGHDVFWGGYTSYFRDLDGHVWEVAWNPGFPIDETGAIQLPD